MCEEGDADRMLCLWNNNKETSWRSGRLKKCVIYFRLGHFGSAARFYTYIYEWLCMGTGEVKKKGEK